ncbi:MAG: transketolase family protein, partial [Spirochaetales bacterium]|nr:transketolase family protein [Spirochaetales bacterium]
MDKTTMIAQRVAFGKALAEAGAEFEKLVVMDADVGASTQTKYFKDAYPDRFYQCGIAEANMVGMAAGLSTTGWVPFVSTFAVFLAKRAADQVRVSVAYPALEVKLNGSYAGLPTGKAGATHSSVEDIAVMRAMPNMKVLDPADPVEVRSAVYLALRTPGPVYVRSVRCPVP